MDEDDEEEEEEEEVVTMTDCLGAREAVVLANGGFLVDCCWGFDEVRT